MTSNASAIAPADHTAVGPLAHDTRGGISNPILGMILFITSEVMFFAGLFAAYFNVRANSPHWPPTQPPELAEHFNLHAEPWFALILTIILVTSSVTCQLGVAAIRRNDRTAFIRAISVTLVLGILFLLGQAYDYSQLGFGLGDGVFGTTFYTLTGFHGAHVTLGVVMLLSLLILSLRGGVTQRDAINVEIVGLYWHFVDIVWIVIFTLVYLITPQ